MTGKWTRGFVVAIVVIVAGVGLYFFEGWTFDRGKNAALAEDIVVTSTNNTLEAQPQLNPWDAADLVRAHIASSPGLWRCGDPDYIPRLELPMLPTTPTANPLDRITFRPNAEYRDSGIWLVRTDEDCVFTVDDQTGRVVGP